MIASHVSGVTPDDIGAEGSLRNTYALAFSLYADLTPAPIDRSDRHVGDLVQVGGGAAIGLAGVHQLWRDR
jgi:hypothetical protein